MVKAINIGGANISGLSAAIELINNGYIGKINIYEKGQSIASNHPLNVQVLRNYESKKDQIKTFDRLLDIKINDYTPIYSIKKYAPSLENFEIRSKKPLFYTLLRGGADSRSLEYQFYEKLKNNANINFFFNRTKNLNYYNIIATGAPFVSGRILAYTLTHDSDQIKKGQIQLFHDNEYAPGGYVYIAPYTKELVTIGLVSTDLQLNLDTAFASFSKKNSWISDLMNTAKIENKFNGFGYYNLPITAQIQNHIFVGGSAGFLDAARGFGIKYAILSGYAAGKSITCGEDFDFIWNNLFKDELRENLSRRFYLDKLSNEDYNKIFSSQGKISKISKYVKYKIAMTKKTPELNGYYENIQDKYPLAKLLEHGPK